MRTAPGGGAARPPLEAGAIPVEWADGMNQMAPGAPEYEKALDDFIALRRRTFYPKTDLTLPQADLLTALARKPSAGEALKDQAAEVVRQVFGRMPLQIEFKPAGTFHLLYRISFAADENYFLRAEFVFTARPAFEFAIEEAVPALLSTPGLRTLKTDLSREVFPLDYQIVAEAQGHRLTELENPETQFLPDEVLEDWGRTLAQVHQRPAGGAGLLNPRSLQSGRVEGVLGSWNEYLRLNLRSHLETCVAARALPAENIPFIETLVHKTLGELRTASTSLLHGDPGHHNVFTQNGKISAVIDWEDALAGDPMFDIAYWGTFVRDYLREPFLRGYREIFALPEDFEIRYWLYYLRISLSKTAHRHLFGIKDRPGRPPASDRITKALTHLKSLTR